MDRKQIQSIVLRYLDGTEEETHVSGWHFKRPASEDRKKEGTWIWTQNEVLFRTDERKVEL